MGSMYGYGYGVHKRTLIKGSDVGLRVQQIATRSEQNLAISGSLTTTNQKMGGRFRFYFSHDCDNIQFGFNGFHVADEPGSGNRYCVETPLGFDYTIRGAVEFNGMSVAFGGGIAKTVPGGSPLVLLDQLNSSAFGLSMFPEGGAAWGRIEKITPVGGNALYHYAAQNSPSIAGENFRSGALSATDVLTATGDWPTTGGWNAHGVVWLPCCIIGEVQGKKMASVITGASNEQGAGETGRGDGFNGSGGYPRRAWVAGKGAKIGLMKSGESLKSFIANSVKRQVMFQYANHAYDGHVGNDYTYGETVENTMALLPQLWALFRAGGIEKISQIGTFPKTNGTWTTQAGQTPRAGFEVGGAWRDVINNFSESEVGNLIDYYINLDASISGLAEGSTRDKFRTNLGAASIDGTHLSSVLHAAAATQLEGIIETHRVAYEGV